MDETLEPVQETSACAHCEEYLAGWKRAQADYANLKRDTERERGDYAKFANQRLLDEMLPVIDQFEQALTFLPDLSNVPDVERKKVENWIMGMKAVKSLWSNTFTEIGLEQVSIEGHFDLAIHEVVGQEERADLADGQIIRAVMPGWKLNGKLLRPAKVIVATTIAA
ncbi:nucleotide exchange factor GrpE [Patescibacteria group bacterium]|nr:nucleotide exchange factor GrpE [Patescibacteria group bacterium]